ncbi:hypothetical protein INR49_013943 [Caranx melampygus]|nr:hypothetical protein INR49_013943 [Caranx melampygus]
MKCTVITDKLCYKEVTHSLTELDERVRPRHPGHFSSVLVVELIVEVFEVCLWCPGVRRRAAEEEEEMGCTSAKQVSAVPNGEESQNKAHSNGDLLSDEYKMKGVEKVKYISGEEGGVDGQDSTEKSALLGKGQHMDETGSNGNEKILAGTTAQRKRT